MLGTELFARSTAFWSYAMADMMMRGMLPKQPYAQMLRIGSVR